ncbi:EamA family transporter [Chitinophaga horti]|uniref:EamA family transporter n=1 Tax=Chitinophaga horti TaxID=2920382 RepID=A0ABY6IXV4_9BACT|nr:EamA family transporter [Chitinophaga horti]UYQ91237.1 EamA family transporter [Chitinophaga horti]
MWWMYALLSALFAAMTAVFTKVGVVSINSNLATCIRTMVILILACTITLLRGEAKGLGALSKQGVYSLLVSGLATGLSWLFYFKAIQVGKLSQVAPVDKLSVALTLLFAIVFLGETLT